MKSFIGRKIQCISKPEIIYELVTESEKSFYCKCVSNNSSDGTCNKKSIDFFGGESASYRLLGIYKKFDI